MKTTKLFFSVLLVALVLETVFFSSCSKPCNIEETQAYADADSLWAAFRAKNPYNFQIAGIKQYPDHSYNILLSEPSDKVHEESLQSFFKEYNCSIKTFKQPMGYDGWLKDAVVSFNDIKSKDIPLLTSKLFDLLYGTDYKAFLLDLDNIPERTAFSSQNLNYQISAEELRTWFIDQRQPLVNAEDHSIVTTLEEALMISDNDCQLYYSNEPGFVVWTLLRSDHMDRNDFLKKARMFALDSDLILGAISNERRTAIIARERSIPVYELPPMRQEILALLAETRKNELSQSLDIFNLFAGKLQGGKDFAPIWLSDELWHTELGNILNLTDLILKSWSENGQFVFGGFESYPQPIDWAFNKGAIYDINDQHFNFQSLEEDLNNGALPNISLTPLLVYNWNTKGAGYTLEEKDLSIYALNRTGALPVSFYNNLTYDKVLQDTVYINAEEKAYDFFSSLSNPDLVKVVQYTSMYQIFNNYGIHIPETVMYFPNAITTYDLDEKAESVLNSLCTSETAKNDMNLKQAFEARLRKEIGSEFYNEFTHYEDFKQLWRKRTSAYFDETYKNVRNSYSYNEYNAFKRDAINNLFKVTEEYTINTFVDTYYNAFVNSLDSIIGYLYDNRDVTINGQPFLRVIGHHLLNFRRIDVQSLYENELLSDDQCCQYLAMLVSQQSAILKTYNCLLGIVSNEEAKEAYLQENKDKSSLWQKTPTIVETWWNNQDSAYIEGGHDLSSSTTLIKINDHLAPGVYNVTDDYLNGQKNIEICSKDQSRITPSFIRNIEQTKATGTYRFDQPNNAVRSQSDVLSITQKRSARGFNVTDHGRTVIARESKGYVINGKKVSSSDALIDEFAKCVEAGGVAPFKTLEFEAFSESEQIAIIDGLKTRLDRSRAFSSIPNRSFDISKVEFTDLGEGKTIAKIPINAQDVRVTTASLDESFTKTNTLWGHVKNAWLEFKIPTDKLQQFKAIIREFFKNPAGTWNRFQFQRKLKSEGFDPVEIKETYEFSASIAMLYIHQNNEYHVLFEKNIA